MKVKSIVIMLVLLLSSIRANAGSIPILYSMGEEIEKVMSLPLREEFQLETPSGRTYHGELGILHEQFSIFGVPLVNYGTEKYVLYTPDDHYYELSASEVKYIRDTVGYFPLTPELPFWDKWGGKLVALAIIFVIYLFIKLD